MNAVLSSCCNLFPTSKARTHRPLALAASAFLTCFVMFGCQSQDFEPDQTMRAGTVRSAIMGGYQSFEDNAVVLLTRWGGGGFGLCSGSLIAPNVVLTAQHCVADTVDLETGSPVDGVICSKTGFNPPYPAFSMAITTRPYISQNYADYHRVKEIVLPDDGQSGFCGRDVAILILEEAVPTEEAVPLVPRVDDQLEAGEMYSAIGYGHTGLQNDSGVRRRRDGLTLTCVGGTDCLFLPYNQEWLGETGVCSGDSGGPAVDQFGRVTGIASRGPALCASPVYGSVYSWGDFIKSTVQRASAEAGLTAPDWVNGWPTHPAYSAQWGEICQNGVFCESGLCLGGHCSRACNTAAPCGKGYECVDVPEGAALFESDYCAPITVGGACSADIECSDRCVEGICSRYCDENLTCPNGFSCTDAVCTPAVLGGPCNETCAGGQCVDGVCSRACSQELPCPSGWQCDGGVCGLIATGAECLDDAECVGGRCAEGLCTRYCDAAAPCSDGWVCNADIQQCELGDVGQVCDESGVCATGVCLNGQCTRECSATAPCPPGYECAGEGLCVPVPSGQSSGCSTHPLNTGSAVPVLLCVLMLALWRGNRGDYHC